MELSFKCIPTLQAFTQKWILRWVKQAISFINAHNNPFNVGLISVTDAPLPRQISLKSIELIWCFCGMLPAMCNHDIVFGNFVVPLHLLLGRAGWLAGWAHHLHSCHAKPVELGFKALRRNKPREKGLEMEGGGGWPQMRTAKKRQWKTTQRTEVIWACRRKEGGGAAVGLMREELGQCTAVCPPPA